MRTRRGVPAACGSTRTRTGRPCEKRPRPLLGLPTSTNRRCELHAPFGPYGPLFGRRRTAEQQARALAEIADARWRADVRARGRRLLDPDLWARFESAGAHKECRILDDLAREIAGARNVPSVHPRTLIDALVPHRHAATRALCYALAGTEPVDREELATALRVFGVYACATQHRLPTCACLRSVLENAGARSARCRLSQPPPGPAQVRRCPTA